MKAIHPYIAIAIVWLSSSQQLFSQKQANMWYFGSHAAIDFNQNPPAPLHNSQMLASLGNSIADRQTGRLLFYTDGTQLAWDSTHQLMPALQNGTHPFNTNSYGGNSWGGQNSLIAPQPGNDSLYYIFSTVKTPNGLNSFCLTYSIINMNKHNHLGDFTVMEQLLLDSITSGIAGVVHGNGQDVWIIVHKWKTDSLYAYLLTANGIQNPVINDMSSRHFNNGYQAFNDESFNFSVDGSRFCEYRRRGSYRGNAMGCIFLYTFNNMAGLLSNSITDTLFPNTNSINMAVFNLSFSPDGSRLYFDGVRGNVSANQSFAGVVQYNLNAGSPSSIKASRTIVDSIWYAYWNNSTMTWVYNRSWRYYDGLQIAPDGKIYIAIGDSNYLHVIANPNGLGAACQFIHNGFNGHYEQYNNGYAGVGLPNIIATFLVKPQASINYKYCSLDSVYTFTNIGLTGNLTYRWFFGDPSTGANDSSHLHNPFHAFSAPGNFTVTLIASNATQSDTFSHVLYIAPVLHTQNHNPIQLNCGHQQDTLGAAPLPHCHYHWNTSAYITDSTLANPVIANVPPLYSWAFTGTYHYYLNTFDTVHQCTMLDTVTVKVNYHYPTANAGANQLLTCHQQTAVIGSAATAGNSYIWQPSVGLNDSTLANPTTSITHNSSYIVIVTDTLSHCKSRDTVLVHVNEPKTFFSQQVAICANQYYTRPQGQSTNTAGTYIDTLTNHFGCDSIITTILTIHPINQTTINAAICNNQTYTLPNGQSTHTAGTYVDTLTNHFGCDSIITTVLTVHAINQSNINASICSNQTYTLPNGQSTYTAGIYTDTLTNHFGCDSIITTHLAVLAVSYYSQSAIICSNQFFTLPNGQQVNTANQYSTIIPNYAGCDSVITTTLSINPLPIVDLGNDTNLCAGNVLVLNASSSTANSQYEWNDLSTNPIKTITTSGIYTIQITASPCAPVLDSIHIHFIDCSCDMLMPNAFTPNNDNKDDDIKPIYACDLQPLDYSYKIFNRWGQLVFQTTDYTMAWDGTFNGKPQPIATYVYFINWKNPSGDIHLKKGDVSLIR